MKNVNIFLLLVLFTLMSCTKTSYEKRDVERNGTVIAKSYQPEEYSNSSGGGMTTSGELVFAGGSSYSEESFNVVVYTTDKRSITINDVHLYAETNVGDTIKIKLKQTIRIKNIDNNIDEKIINEEFISAYKVK